MTDTFIISVAREALWVALMISAPILGIGLIIGLVVSIFQATTQIHEQTLTFIPKLLGILIALVIFGPWMLHSLTSFASKILANLNQFTFIK
ncbi:MAG TPA: flagellar biosynthesis protein FliQ [Bacillota bacterium]|nr:flagellar biosynthesis protein FliQ [Bacillota bacterium]HPT87869.1 flagellar biosynthesis protein FliQ [Bacillota bacterium]